MDPLGQTRFDPPDLPDELQRQLLAWFDAELDPAERERELAALQAERPEWAVALRREFDQLLADRAPRDAAPDDPSPPSRIGPYRITATLGQGGMGIVYAAERTDPIHQRVALKVVKRGMATREVLSRFALERRTLAAMNHPAIARVFDAGETDRGEPYFVMELVAGLPVDEYCDRHRLDLAERLELFQRICAGVQHAHQRGVIHRDLKPGNVLVHQEGEEHLPKILDFGLAKATDQDLLDSTVNTRIDQILGTPEYMAPEQATEDAEAIDTRADVYSLGVILYQLLTGELPFPSAELRRAGLLGALRMIREQDPPKPSTRLSSTPDTASRQAARSRTPLPHLTRALKGDLDWVVLRALAKEPARRYESAAGLAADLRRFLNHEPLEAGPPSASYRLGKLLRRYRMQAIGLTAVFVTAVVGAVVAIGYAREALEQSRRAGENLDRFKARTEEFDQLAAAVHVERLEEIVAEPPPAWPAHLDTYEQAFAGLDRLAELEQPIETTLQKLRDRSAVDANGERQFAAEHDRFLFETLTRVQASSRFLRQSEEVARSRDRDLVWVRHLAELEAGDSWRREWTEAQRVLAVSPRYADADVGTLQPQHGLLPLGQNPATGLLEFYHLRSAWDGTSDPAELPVPHHDERTGHIEVTPDSGIVFVLLPGGRCTLGAQGNDPAAPNYDPFAPRRNPRAPVNEVEIRDAEVQPFFLARHELTQAQWRRLVFGNLPPDPSIPKDRPIHPVNHVTWEWCVALLARYQLALPSEDQWEYACRAGTSTPWWPGRDPKLLADVVRVGDVVDVGTLRANPFGLHDVHGNVWEWCTDAYAQGLTRFVPAEPAAALGLGPAPYRALRGGGRYDPSYLSSRAARVEFETANTAATDGGCRPMRPLLD